MRQPTATLRRGLACAALAAAAATAAAQPSAPPQNVVTLAASASLEVSRDWLTVTFSTNRDGSDAGQVQAALRSALDTALAEARKAARPGQLEVQTGGFSIYPRYASGKFSGGVPTIAGWTGSVELTVQGRDVGAISQLVGRIHTLSIARVGYTLSREAREKVEGEVTAQAIDRYRARAEAVARQFGYAGYTLREVTVNSDLPMPQPVPMMARALAVTGGAQADTLPTEAGKATVTVNVSGSVQLK
ncbi:MAG: SIMPL domain-containing protein [Burkholderiales bacterium]|nr:SIMPL domain-containing protein [Burkholderiales bacterium]MDE1927326.1 SIMPL domain-containing protein [Burkholderiales bacterium]MDE2160911.1 SIMPL domain-containing protein [Burkholderiales bacterium]MDE2501802.1 SIMPL domain-containing protein [Burkholderiales bacterium]